MLSSDFKKALSPKKDAIYETLLEAADCGPFDGGCVVFAQALQRVIGGRIVVLLNKQGYADHACVELGAQLIDFDGPLRPLAFMRRFSRNENVVITGYRPIRDGDLQGAIRNDCVESTLTEILSKSLHKIPNRSLQDKCECKI